MKSTNVVKMVVWSAVAVVAFELCSAQAAQAQTIRLGNGQLLGFQNIRGQWAGENQQKAQGAVWQFNPANRTFTMMVPGGVAVPGTYTINGKVLTFTGAATFNFGYTGGTRIEVAGTIDMSGTQPIVTMLYAAASTTAATTVGGGAYGDSRMNAFAAKVALRVIN